AVKGTSLENMTLEEIFENISSYPVAVKKNAGQFYNHDLYWKILSPQGGGEPQEPLYKAITDEFGSLKQFKEDFGGTANAIFGSGWAWLSVDEKGKLFISNTSNDENPLMDLVEKKGTPLLSLDVWEHAYYLKYKNKRSEYVDAIWDIINWDEVNTRYKEVIE
ncbi:superoxide dismutase, partial [Bacteroidota bacterium]